MTILIGNASAALSLSRPSQGMHITFNFDVNVATIASVPSKFYDILFVYKIPKTLFFNSQAYDNVLMHSNSGSCLRIRKQICLDDPGILIPYFDNDSSTFEIEVLRVTNVDGNILLEYKFELESRYHVALRDGDFVKLSLPSPLLYMREHSVTDECIQPTGNRRYELMCSNPWLNGEVNDIVDRFSCIQSYQQISFEKNASVDIFLNIGNMNDVASCFLVSFLVIFTTTTFLAFKIIFGRRQFIMYT